ncbi:hypothetical protein KIF24_24910 [Micromonospora sp. Llam7]|uniref:hypothetical protein n=1 Tax=Micromonospora tarapacensis TaxID=2835305 RepID=UPI001C8326AC|nr:hypothetical protein [Micromonospora tarapacensis]MBX7268951.1 hypothetical protein [Micromonospora tarapacensis]
MTYGDWLGRAHDDLTHAQTRLRSDPAVTFDDIGATVFARHRVYLRLAKLVELVTGGQPARSDIDRDTVDIALQTHAGDHATRLYLGLTAAARVARRDAPTTAPICRVGRHLDSAAEAVAVAGEILASHTPPMKEPLTPEGIAIRAGAGQKAALADIAALTHDMLAIDAGLPEWLSSSHSLAHDVYAPVADEARWASAGRLTQLSHQVRADAGDAPSLLHLLEMPPIPGGGRAITEGATARSALIAARDWMHRNAGDVRAVHLATATQAGLAISALATTHAAGADWRSWSAAAHAASQLHGTPPHGPAVDVARELGLVARWVRPGPARPGQLTTGGPRREAIDKLATVLPSLAEVLSAAAQKAARHGNFFVVGRRSLERVPGSLVYHAVARWSVARPDHEQIYRLRSALYGVGASALASAPPHLPRAAPRLAKLAFAATAGTEPTNRVGVAVDQAVQQRLSNPSRRDRSHR